MTDSKSNGQVDSDGIWWIPESDIVWRRVMEQDEPCWTNSTHAIWRVTDECPPITAISVMGFSQCKTARVEKIGANPGEWIRIPPFAIQVFATVGERPTHVEEVPRD